MVKTGDSAMDPTPGGGERSDALVAAAELEHRRRESRQRRERLEQERRMLGEMRDALQRELKLVDGQLGTAREEDDRLQGRIDAAARRLSEVDRGMEEHRREVAVWERRRSDSEALGTEISQKIDAAERELAAERDAMLSVSEELELGRSLLARIDQRLSLSRVKG